MFTVRSGPAGLPGNDTRGEMLIELTVVTRFIRLVPESSPTASRGKAPSAPHREDRDAVRA